MFAGDTLVALHPTPLAEGGRLGEIPVIWEGQLLWVASAPPPETALAGAKGVPLAVWRWGPGDDDPTVVFTLPGTEEWKSSKRNAILVPSKDKSFGWSFLLAKMAKSCGCCPPRAA